MGDHASQLLSDSLCTRATPSIEEATREVVSGNASRFLLDDQYTRDSPIEEARLIVGCNASQFISDNLYTRTISPTNEATKIPVGGNASQFIIDIFIYTCVPSSRSIKKVSRGLRCSPADKETPTNHIAYIWKASSLFSLLPTRALPCSLRGEKLFERRQFFFLFKRMNLRLAEHVYEVTSQSRAMKSNTVTGFL